MSSQVVLERHSVVNSAREPLYGIWNGIWHRCYNETAPSFRHYGARGIKMHPRWACFYCFKEDMGPRPSPRHSVDRKDNERGYGPDNCRWATGKEQNANRRPPKRESVARCPKCSLLWRWSVEVPAILECRCGNFIGPEHLSALVREGENILKAEQEAAFAVLEACQL